MGIPRSRSREGGCSVSVQSFTEWHNMDAQQRIDHHRATLRSDLYSLMHQIKYTLSTLTPVAGGKPDGSVFGMEDLMQTSRYIDRSITRIQAMEEAIALLAKNGGAA